MEIIVIALGIIALFFIPTGFMYICCAASEEKKAPITKRKPAKPGFWKRQFQAESTLAQRRFDWIFGVILPVVCFSFDFFIFKGAMSSRGAMFGEYKPFAYLLSFVSIVLLMLFLLFGQKLKWFNAVLAGLFAVGAAVSLIVGVILLPFSLIGLIVLIGALGFTPLFTAFVYTRNTIRSFTFADEFIKNNSLIIHLSVVSAIFSFVLPYVFYANVENSLRKIEVGSPTEIQWEVKKLKFVSPLINVDRLGASTCGTTENETIAEKRKAFFELSGQSPDELGMQYCGDW